MGIRDKALIAVLALVVLISLSSNAQARADYVASSKIINIWSGSPATRNEENCTSLLTDAANDPTGVGKYLKTCTSNFASTCISVDANLNITRGSAGNWTNFSVNGCELRMNRSASDSASNFIITSWGNFTVIKSNITTNDSEKYSAIIIKANSNFSMSNSFVSQMGWTSNANKRGLELNSPTFAFNNNTLTSNYYGITLLSGASGSVLTNINASSNYEGIYLYSSSNNNILTDITANENYNGIYLYVSSNNILTNITANLNSNTGIYLGSGSNNNILTDITANENNYGVYFYSSSNDNLFKDSNLSLNSIYDVYLMYFSGVCINNTFLNVSYSTEQVDSGSQLIRQWYFDSYTSPAVNNANITIRNSSQSLINYSYTNSTGWIQRLILTAYINNGVSPVSQWQPYNVSAFASGYVNITDESVPPTTALTGNIVKILTLTQPDTTPPTRSGGAPTGALPAGTTQTPISLNTDESATCKYSVSADVSYASMPNTFSTTGGTSHSTQVSGLQDGQAYNYYVRCQDAAGNANSNDYIITFSVSTPSCTPSVPLCNGICPSGCINAEDPDCAPASLCSDGQTCSASPYCQSGNCVGGVCQTAQQPPGGGGSTPGFEPSLLALMLAALVAALFLPKLGR